MSSTGTGRLTFSPAERATETRALSDDVVINVLDQLISVFTFLRVAMTNLRSPSPGGILLGEGIKLPFSI